MRRRLTILGCGSSTGVPRIGPSWGRCDPENPKNQRLRCAVLVEQFNPKSSQATRVLVDTPPDLRQQLLKTHTSALDGVLFTHDHADHTHGIDDLRIIAYANRKRVPCYFNAATGDSVMHRFDYCFKGKEKGGYPSILEGRIIADDAVFDISGAGGTVNIMALRQHHGAMLTLGFRFGGLAYSPDVSDIDDDVAERMTGLDVWIVDALRYEPHPSHFHVKKALHWIERLKPKRAIITHMTSDLDYEVLKRELPEGVEPAYDGMEIAF